MNDEMRNCAVTALLALALAWPFNGMMTSQGSVERLSRFFQYDSISCCLPMRSLHKLVVSDTTAGQNFC